MHRSSLYQQGLRIRHASALVLRNLGWLNTEQPLPDPFLGRSLPEALELNNFKSLATAAENLVGSIEAESRKGTFAEKVSDRVSRVMEGVLFAYGG